MLSQTTFFPEQTWRQELQPGERILWTGKPRQGLMLRPTDAMMIPFSLLWGGFALFWETLVIAGGAPFFFALWGIPFVLVGCYMIFGRFFVEAAIRGHTDYALTSERVLIRGGLFNRNLRSVSLKTLADMTLNVKSDGRGSITFGQASPLNAWYGNAFWFNNGRYSPPAFEGIENVREVYSKIQRAQQELK